MSPTNSDFSQKFAIKLMKHKSVRGSGYDDFVNNKYNKFYIRYDINNNKFDKLKKELIEYCMTNNYRYEYYNAVDSEDDNSKLDENVFYIYFNKTINFEIEI